MSDSSILTQLIIPFLTAMASGFSGWFYGRRRSKADTDKAVIGNLDLIIDMWKKTATELEERYEEVLKAMENMRNENELLREKLHELRNVVNKLSCENKNLLKRIAEIKECQISKDE